MNRLQHVLSFIILTPISCLVQTAAAADLIAVYQDALKSDPAYHAAIETALAEQTLSPQARAALLPSISGQAEWSKTKSTVKRSSGPEQVSPTTPYQHHALTLRQPVYDPVNWALFEGSRWTAQKAHASIRAARQDLIVRTAAAYYNVLQAQDDRDVAQTQQKANARQLALAKQRYQAGLEAITAVYDAQASYDSAHATLIQADYAIENAKEALRQITGHYYATLSPLRRNHPWSKPHPEQVNDWAVSAKTHNPRLQAAHYQSLVQKSTVKSTQSAHLPVVALSGTLTRQGNRHGSNNLTGNGLVDNQSMAINVSVPIFEGGLLVYKTRQAQYTYQALVHEEDRVKREVMAQVHQAYNQLISSISMIRANKQGVLSASSALESNEAAYQVGTRTMIDVLMAQQTVSEAKRKLAAAQYLYINSLVNLKQASGMLDVQTVFDLNAWLEP